MLRYVYDESTRQYRVEQIDPNVCLDPYKEDPSKYTGRSSAEYLAHFPKFGHSRIIFQVRPLLQLFMDEIVNGLFIMQCLTLFYYFYIQYTNYAVCIVIVLVYEVASQLWYLRVGELDIQDKVVTDETVEVKRDGCWVTLDSSDILPGDLVKYYAGSNYAFDSIILKGSCIVDESMLTGESVPVRKEPVNLKDTNPADRFGEGNILYYGSKIHVVKNQEVEWLEAFVLNTGFLTVKGNMIRVILQPNHELDFLSNNVSYYLIWNMVICCIAYFFCFHGLAQFYPLWMVCWFGWDLTTTFVPIPLPVAIFGNVIHSVQSLKQGPYKTNTRTPQKLVKAGCVDMVVFDKTGTLTELDLKLTNTIGDDTQAILQCFGFCHSLVSLNDQIDGDPLEIEFFRNSGYNLTTENDSIYCDNGNHKVKMLKTNKFDHRIARMSVIVEDKSEFWIYVKGSPESILSICRKDSCPENVYDTIDEYSSKGLRLIVLARKQLSSHDLATGRQDQEQDLCYLGLAVLENKLKPESVDSIQTLINAGIGVKIATGDHLKTAVAVCSQFKHNFVELYKIIVVNNEVYYLYENESYEIEKWLFCPEDDFHYAIEGVEFYTLCEGFYSGKISKEIFDNVLCKTTVYARMSPDNKKQLVEGLMNLGYVTGMCGDGSNDCKALKASDVGLSLSQAESSISAPFTSDLQNISSYVNLLREGRNTMGKCMMSLKVGIHYAVLEGICVTLLNSRGSNLTPTLYLYSDMIMTFSIFYGITKFSQNPHFEKLDQIRTFLDPRIFLSFILIFLVEIVVLTYVFEQVQYVKGYSPPSANLIGQEYDVMTQPYLMSQSFESAAIGKMLIGLNLIACVNFTNAYPYSSCIWSNLILLAIYLTHSLVDLTFIFPMHWEQTLMGFKSLDFSFSLMMVQVLIASACTIYVVDKYIVYCLIDLYKYVTKTFTNYIE